MKKSPWKLQNFFRYNLDITKQNRTRLPEGFRTTFLEKYLEESKKLFLKKSKILYKPEEVSEGILKKFQEKSLNTQYNF